jgi:TrmH family RNA methyltransferase
MSGVLTEVFVTPAMAAKHDDILVAARTAGAEVRTATEGVIEALAQTVTPQGIVGVCRFIDVAIDQCVRPGISLVALLANVRDPGNAGTVIRTADAAGADAVVLAGESVDPYNAKCVRASVGSIFHVPIAVGVPVLESIERAKAAGLTVLGADGDGDLDLDAAIDGGVLARPTAWVFGNEAWGLTDDVLAACDHVVSVPIHGTAESLNLATAAAVCLYASAREQRRPLR